MVKVFMGLEGTGIVEGKKMGVLTLSSSQRGHGHGNGMDSVAVHHHLYGSSNPNQTKPFPDVNTKKIQK